MEIAKNDELIENMKILIIKREQEFINNYLELKNQKNENNFLSCLTDDYKKYYDYIVKIKQDQYNTLKKISEYLDTIACRKEKTKTTLNELKYDQNNILNEMESIKNDLDKLIN